MASTYPTVIDIKGLFRFLLLQTVERVLALCSFMLSVLRDSAPERGEAIIKVDMFLVMFFEAPMNCIIALSYRFLF